MNKDEQDIRHKQRMQRKKEIVDSSIAKATEDRGVLVVNTGNGKGKSSAAFGMVARAMGHDMKIGVVQFIKGAFSTGEEAFYRRFPEIDYHVMGQGFTWETQDKRKDTAAAQAARKIADSMLCNQQFDLVIFDELNIALKYKYVDIDQVLDATKNRPHNQHVVITGRAAPQALIDAADTVTEMPAIKHAFQNGVRAQKGVEL